LNTNSAAWLATNADTQPPAWDSTAVTGPTAPKPRVGTQEVVPGDGSATVYWDVARDQTGPVYYNLYYSIGGSVGFGTATRLAHVPPHAPANYNYPTGTGPGVYPYCGTVTGLQNGLTYSFAVRAEDSCNPGHEDPNTVCIAVVAGTNVLGTFKNIKIDGSFSDWTGVPWAYQGAPDGDPVNYLQVQFANDTNNFYGHVKLASPYALFSDYYSHVFFDTDLEAQTGYPVTGALFGSKMMIESGNGFDQRNGSFNAGPVSNLGWAVLPSRSTNEFEFQVSLSAMYSDSSPVFGRTPFRVLLQDDRGPETAVETGIEYRIASPQLGPLFLDQLTSVNNIIWTGPGALQYSSTPAGPWTSLTNAASPYPLRIGDSPQFFRLANQE
jgi:hypothetical protein